MSENKSNVTVTDGVLIPQDKKSDTLTIYKILNYHYSRKIFSSLLDYIKNTQEKIENDYTFLILLIISQSLRDKGRCPSDKVRIRKPWDYRYTLNKWNNNAKRIIRRRYYYIKYVLEHTDIDINKPDSDGFTPLSWACRLGLYDIAKLLIDNGADVNKANNALRNPLITTIRSRNFYRHMSEKIILDISELLIKNNININNNDYDYSPLYYAVEKDYHTVVKLLVENNANLDKKIIKNPRFLMNISILKLLILRYGVNTLNTPNNMGYSLTHYAIQLGEYDIAKFLLKHMDEKLRNIYYISNPHIFSSVCTHRSKFKYISSDSEESDSESESESESESDSD